MRLEKYANKRFPRPVVYQEISAKTAVSKNGIKAQTWN